MGSAWRLRRQGPGFKSRHPDLFHVYILYSESLKRYYVGSTEDVEERLKEHNAGKTISTHAGIPWDLVHTESYQTRSQAINQEHKIKARGIWRYLTGLGLLKG